MTKTSRPVLAELPANAGPAADVFRLDYGTLEEAFPAVDEPFIPFGDKVLLQIRTAMGRTKGGIIVPDEARDTEQWNTQVGKGIRLGPVAFCNRDTLQPWPEGAWVKPGMFVLCPKFGGDRCEVPIPNSQDSAIFALFLDVELGGEIPERKVLETVAYLKA